MDLTSGALGAGALGVGYVIVLQLKKWIPAGWSALKARLGSGKLDLASIEAAATAEVRALEQGVVADLQKGVAALTADVAKLKTTAPHLFPPSA